MIEFIEAIHINIMASNNRSYLSASGRLAAALAPSGSSSPEGLRTFSAGLVARNFAK